MLLRADSLASTHAVAAAIASLARPGDIIVLAGEMGAGKTAFAQGFGRALGITEAITSPTFTLVHSYPVPGAKLTMHHADLYRLDSTSDVDDLALHELAEFGGIVLIEWGDVAASTLGDHLEVRLSADDEPDDGPADEPVDAEGPACVTVEADDFGLDEARMIELHASGPAWAGRWDRLRDALEAYRC
ncbi:MAG: tRNA (adenosine(37)-N6)-threonylcarbamoyltransferase complex ATPase subunit type 1 TsaE [Acidimicrobiia bacterium]